MSKIQTLKKDDLPVSSSSPGIHRHLAFKGNGYIVLRSRSAPGVTSGWHHHGDYDVFGYLAYGIARFERDHGENDSISIHAGDFFHVPPNTIHREINPSADEENEMVLFLCGTGPLVTNVDDPG